MTSERFLGLLATVQQYEIGDARVANENQAAIKTAPTPKKKETDAGCKYLTDTRYTGDGDGW